MNVMAAAAPPKPSAPKVNLQAFEAISAFVNDLWEANGTARKTPLSNYYRIISAVKLSDKDRISVINNGFAKFFATYGGLVAGNKLGELPPRSVVSYNDSDTIYVDVELFYRRGDPDVKKAIRNHLLTIQATLDPSKPNMEALESIISGESGGGSIGTILGEVASELGDTMKGVPEGDAEAALDRIIESGLLKKMFKRVKGMVDSSGGGADPSALLGSLKSVASGLIGAMPK